MTGKTTSPEKARRTPSGVDKPKPGTSRRKKAPPAHSSLPANNGHEPSEALQAAFFLDLPAAAAVFDADNRLIISNKRFAEVFELVPTAVIAGTPVDELIQFTLLEDVFDDFSHVNSFVDSIAQLAPGEIGEATLVLQDGRKIGQSVKKLEDGHWLAIYSDVTSVLEAEAQAREAENRWNFALESARQGVWDTNLVTGDTFYSHMWRVIRGLENCPEEKLTPQSWHARLHPEDREHVLDSFDRLTTGEVLDYSIEYRERHRDGHWIWISSRGRALTWDVEGKPTRILGTDTDVTETRNAQAALAESEERWNFALQATGQGVWDCDIVTGDIYYSPTWRAARGLSENDTSIKTYLDWLERVHPDDRERLRDITRRHRAGEIRSISFEYRERHVDGHYMWFQGAGETIAQDENGKPTRVIGVDTDITIRKELELKVRESLQILNTALDNFPGGICMYDKDLVLKVANSSYYEINRIDEAWFPVGSKLNDILRYHTERGDYGEGDVDAIVAERFVEANNFTPAKFNLTRSDGTTIEYKRIPMPAGGFVMTFEDITERLEAENEKTRLEKELVQAQRLESLGTLASGIAHEINTPIQYVGDNIRFIGQSLRDLLKVLQLGRKALRLPIDPGFVSEQAENMARLEEKLDLGFILEELPQALDQSAQGVKQVATIVKAIKEFSHPGQEHKVEFDINSIIETTLIVSRNQWKYVAEVETDLDPSLPSIKCLPGEIGQALLNLVVNAAQAIETAAPEKGLIRVTSRQEDGSIIVEVQDNGCGIPDSLRDRIYDPFFTTKDIGKGTGQGLSIVFSAVVKKHGGAIDCVSHEGEGTTFILSLPIEEAGEQDKEAAA